MADKTRALVVGVGRFAPPSADDEPPDDAPYRPPLEFVYEVVPEVEEALAGLGYAVDTRLDPQHAALRTAIDQAFDKACTVVHLVSHGERPHGGDPTRIHLVPADGITGRDTNISDWISTAQENGRPMLFLLDLCHAGTAARLPFFVGKAGQDTNAWVIAGSGVDQYAYDGRFSTAVVHVLRRLARSGLETHPTRRYVAFSVVARHVGRELAAMEGYQQQVHATPLDPAFEEPELPFFPNPRYVDDPQRQAVQRIDAMLRAFVEDLGSAQSELLDELDEALDARHFLDRVGADFVGRRHQLRQLAPWLDGAVPGGLRVVTGNPGAGKSALLGALVSAAHPVINSVVPGIRERLQGQDPEGCPSSNPALAAVHARQHSLREVMVSLGRQLRLTAPADGWTPTALIEAIAGLPAITPIVLDALDEALDPVGVMDRLLIPLAGRRKSNGTPVCRLLVAMRPWKDFNRLRDLAARSGGLVNLDTDVSDAELQADLRTHLTSRLGRLPGYRSPAQRGVRNRLAASIAENLVATTSGRREWGAFLVAGIFSRYLGAIPAAETEQEADSLGASVPATLPDVLELDLAVRTEGGPLRTVLAALAHAEGTGMPAEVAGAVAARFDGRIDPANIEGLLAAGRFYLRTDADRDGTTLYRLFHQGLADYLRGRPFAPPPREVR